MECPVSSSPRVYDSGTQISSQEYLSSYSRTSLNTVCIPLATVPLPLETGLAGPWQAGYDEASEFISGVQGVLS